MIKRGEKMKKINRVKIISCLFFFIITLLIFAYNKRESEEYAFPPLIYVDNNLYQHSKNVTEEILEEGYVYIGDIESRVSSSEMPKNNFQTNRDIVGAAIYKLDNKIIVVYNENNGLYCQLKEIIIQGVVMYETMCK